jgi:tellurite resistance protein TerC
MVANLFPAAEYWWFYLSFTAVIVTLLALDLTMNRRAHPISVREAGLWTVGWISLALLFSVGLYWFAEARVGAGAARQVTLEFLTGYLVEESLSIDNMFVFALVFRYFAVPAGYQHRVLFFGVLGAIVFRGIFIAAGAALIRFHWVVIVFGIFLILTGLRMALEKDKTISPDANPVIRVARRLFPVASEFHGAGFLVRLNGILHFTPLMIVLLVVETTDILFAVDSVPAVFAITKEPLIVFTSNIFAILGLRSIYFLLAGALDRFYALKYGLAFILIFVGLKMAWLDDLAGGRFPIVTSLAVIAAAIGLSIAISLLFPQGCTGRRRHRPPQAWARRN